MLMTQFSESPVNAPSMSSAEADSEKEAGGLDAGLKASSTRHRMASISGRAVLKSKKPPQRRRLDGLEK